MPQHQHRTTASTAAVDSSASAQTDFGSNAARARYALTPASVAQSPVPGGYQNASLNLDGTPRYAQTPGAARYSPTPGTTGEGYRLTPEAVPGGYQNASLNLDGTPKTTRGGYQNPELNFDGSPRYALTPEAVPGGYQNASLNLDGTPKTSAEVVPGGYQNASLNLDGTPIAAPAPRPPPRSALKRPGRTRGRRVRWDSSVVFPEDRRPGVR